MKPTTICELVCGQVFSLGDDPSLHRLISRGEASRGIVELTLGNIGNAEERTVVISERTPVFPTALSRS